MRSSRGVFFLSFSLSFFTHIYFLTIKLEIRNVLKKKKKRNKKRAILYIFLIHRFHYKIIIYLCMCKSFNVLHIENVLEIWIDVKMCRCTMLHALYLGI